MKNLILKMGGENMNYQQVPNIISGKDLDYLIDLFQWNHNGYKQTMYAKDQVADAEIVNFITKASNVFHENLTMVLNILKQGGSNE